MHILHKHNINHNEHNTNFSDKNVSNQYIQDIKNMKSDMHLTHTTIIHNLTFIEVKLLTGT